MHMQDVRVITVIDVTPGTGKSGVQEGGPISGPAAACQAYKKANPAHRQIPRQSACWHVTLWQQLVGRRWTAHEPC